MIARFRLLGKVETRWNQAPLVGCHYALLQLVGHPRYDANVTLLVYTTTARGNEPDGAAFARICHAIDERYPLAFSIVATRGATEATQANSRRDWVTLPDPRGQHSEDTAARMLITYARQYRARATLFVGSDGSQFKDSCRSVSTADDLGEQLVVSAEDTPLAPLFKVLDRVVPASFLISQKSDLTAISDDLKRQPIKAGIALYWDGPPSNQALEILRLALAHTAGTVSVQLGLRGITKNLPVLWRLVSMNEPRISLSIVAEDGLACSTARNVTGLLNHLQRRGS